LRAAYERLGWKEFLKLRLHQSKEMELTTPGFFVSDVTTPRDEIVALQEIRELWIGQSGSKLFVSTRKTSQIN
jgi:hypothetical protein